ncbi:MAG: hypothetical protein EOM49_13140 [Epsilonproteobacteria bacterium]|nr:hypothetical protein [Campylobacterota bacterium]
MPTIKQIREDLKDVRFYYSKKDKFDKAFENVAVNDILDKVDKYNDAVKTAHIRLYDVYIGLYVDNNTQAALAEGTGFTTDYVRQLNRELCEFFQRIFAKEECSRLSGKGGTDENK